MSPTFTKQVRYRTQRAWRLAWVAGITTLVCIQLSFAQDAAELHRTLVVAASEEVTLHVDVHNGDLKIFYGRDGHVSISGYAKSGAGAKLDDNFFTTSVRIEQNGNHIAIREEPNRAYPEEDIQVVYQIDVPYRTEVTSRLGHGQQNISGVLGPVNAVTDKGDITAAYISRGLQAQVGRGNLDLRVIGEHVDAKAGSGDISCMRLPQGVSAETGDGDIALMVVGPSTAIVKKGTGRIDVGGARGTFVGLTDEGDVHIRAIPHADWQLISGSGSVRLELPPAVKFELQASTEAGEFQIDREDIARPDAGSRQFHQKVNGGGTRIDVHTESGKIAIR
jgi:Putative adhesin